MNSKYLMAAAFLLGTSLDASAMMKPPGMFNVTGVNDFSTIRAIPPEAIDIMVNADQLSQLFAQPIDLNGKDFFCSKLR